MAAFVSSSSGACLLVFLGLLVACEAYYLPTSYQRYLDENQAILRALMAASEQQEERLAQKEATQTRQQPDTEPAHNAVGKSKATVTEPKLLAAELVPRRDQRQFFLPPQYKRMRPCFYSPIQCLMKRSEA